MNAIKKEEFGEKRNEKLIIDSCQSALTKPEIKIAEYS